MPMFTAANLLTFAHLFWRQRRLDSSMSCKVLSHRVVLSSLECGFFCRIRPELPQRKEFLEAKKTLPMFESWDFREG